MTKALKVIQILMVPLLALNIFALFVNFIVARGLGNYSSVTLYVSGIVGMYAYFLSLPFKQRFDILNTNASHWALTILAAFLMAAAVTPTAKILGNDLLHRSVQPVCYGDSQHPAATVCHGTPQ